jgi:DNA-binding transcriptional ArsR family regulator
MSSDRRAKSVDLSGPRLEAVARMFAALAEPTRLRILRHLQRGRASVGRIVKALGGRQANVSKQLAILHRARLIERRREGNVVYYWIDEPLIFDLCELVCAKLDRDAKTRVFGDPGPHGGAP